MKGEGGGEKEKEEGDGGEQKKFGILPIDLEVPWGKVVAVVGPIGAGKSSLVQGGSSKT